MKVETKAIALQAAPKLEEGVGADGARQTGRFWKSPDTSIKQATVDKVAKSLITIPEGFKPLKQIEKLLKDRKNRILYDKRY